MVLSLKISPSLEQEAGPWGYLKYFLTVTLPSRFAASRFDKKPARPTLRFP